MRPTRVGISMRDAAGVFADSTVYNESMIVSQPELCFCRKNPETIGYEKSICGDDRIARYVTQCSELGAWCWVIAVLHVDVVNFMAMPEQFRPVNSICVKPSITVRN
jgi:hypothetical protein